MKRCVLQNLRHPRRDPRSGWGGAPRYRCHPVFRSGWGGLLVFLLFLAGAAELAAEISTQSPGSQAELRGVVVDETRGDPVAGVLVSLHDGEGVLRRSMLTGPDGRFAFELPASGAWQVRGARLGYDEVHGEVVEVAGGASVQVTLRIAAAPISLDAVAVEAAALDRCRRLDPEEGTLLVRLWQEARSALRVVAWAEVEERYTFEMVRWDRATDLVSNRVLDESRSTGEASFRPFHTASVEELLEEGWIRDTEDGEAFEYFGLDAAALLSDAFQEAHCFEVREDPSDGRRVGLAFSPVAGRDVAGVEGVLWLDRERAALLELDFHYTEHPHDPPIPREVSPLFNGVVEFRELPDGGWIADRWRLRIPQYELMAGEEELVTSDEMDPELARAFREVIDRQSAWWRDRIRSARLGSIEIGGEITRIETPDGTFLPPRSQAALEGIVMDSTRMAGLGDAEVHLVGTDHRGRTDPEGHFRIEVPLDGTYRVTFEHPRLDTLGVEAIPETEVTLTRGERVTTTLGGPSERTLAMLGCGVDPAGPREERSMAILSGRVVEPVLGEPLAGVQVRLVPEEGVDAPALVAVGESDDGAFTTTTGPDGAYHFCGLPAGVRFEARTDYMGLEGAPRGIHFADGAVVAMDLDLRVASPGEVRGVVRQGEFGPSLGNANVRLMGGGEDRRVTTDSQGRFVFEEIPSGHYDLEVTHLGYQALNHPVEVEGGGRVTRMTVRLLRDAIALDPVVVEVEARPSWGVLAGVYDRRDHMEALGIGTFFDRSDIEQSAASQVTSLVARLPGVTRRPTSPGSAAHTLQIHRTNECQPAFFVDGMPYRLDSRESIDHVVSTWVVEMIEVYRGPSELPMEFFTYEASRCGAVAVWTRRGH
jgi:5-hydroxyisourate hydrolase-like protein (transthyretin family)